MHRMLNALVCWCDDCLNCKISEEYRQALVNLKAAIIAVIKFQ